MTLLEEFSQGLEGKDIDQPIHEAKADSNERILGQGVAYLALFISEVIMDAIVAPERQGMRGAYMPHEQQAVSVHN